MIALAVDRARRAGRLLGGSSTGCGSPIVDFDLFRNGPYFGASAAAFFLVGACWAVIYFQPQYLQYVRGDPPIACGLDGAADHRADGLLSPFSGRLTAKFGPRR